MTHHEQSLHIFTVISNHALLIDCNVVGFKAQGMPYGQHPFSGQGAGWQAGDIMRTQWSQKSDLRLSRRAVLIIIMHQDGGNPSRRCWVEKGTGWLEWAIGRLPYLPYASISVRDKDEDWEGLSKYPRTNHVKF